ncbi:MAG: GGDEF domain-containing protein [Acidobacteriota bacterium]
MGLVLGQLWVKPDPAFRHAGASGELLVAQVRAVLGLFVLIIPAMGLVLDPQRPSVQAGFLLVGVLFVQTLIVYRVLRRYGQLPWLGFASSLLDVTLVSAALLASALFGQGPAGPGREVVFLIYFLAIFATTLRFDVRVCVVTGFAAALQYVVVEHWVQGLVPEAPTALNAWVDEAARVVLLLAATLLAATLVVRGRELRSLSSRDLLTGVMSRRYFDERLEEDAARIEHRRESALCAMIDIDHFKSFNDTYGHSAGDEALRVIGSVLRASFRSSDVVARYGGEEFSVIVVGLAPARAIERMEAIRRTVAESPVPLWGGRSAPMTVSVGAACFPREGSSLRQVLALADERLYEAKGSGRNQVVGPPPEAPASL